VKKKTAVRDVMAGDSMNAHEIVERKPGALRRTKLRQIEQKPEIFKRKSIGQSESVERKPGVLRRRKLR
jgi:hypothetical protein